MKLKYMLGVVLSALSLSGNAQLYSNSTLWVPNGSVVYVNGAFENDTSSNLTNNGTLVAKGDIINRQTFTQHNNGLLRLEGTSVQNVSGTQTFWVFNVDVNNSNGVVLQNSIYADGSVQFLNGIVTATDSNFPFIFTQASTSAQEKDASHVNGYVTREGTGLFAYPVGDGTRYQKVDVSPSANNSGITVRYYPSDAGSGTYTANGTDAELLVQYNTLEYWDIIPNSTATGVVTVYWDDYMNPAVTDVTEVRVAHLHNGEWLNEGTSGEGAEASGSVTANAVSVWSPFTIGATSAVLPVELTTFTVQAKQNVAMLHWATATENNNSHFNVQRSVDGVNFETIVRVQGAGTTNAEQTYYYEDTEASLFANTVYYRLEQVDFDGTQEYSIIQFVSFDGAIEGMMFPNPVSGGENVVVQSKSIQTIDVYNLHGKLMNRYEFNRQNIATIPTNTYAKGIYVVVVNGTKIYKLTVE